MLDRFEFPQTYASVALRSALREAMMRSPMAAGRAVLVNEYPKSGGTWLCRMMRDITDLPFQDNRVPTHARAIMKHHTLKDYPIKRKVIVWRDPRDVMVSLYHHVFFVHQDYGFNAVAVKRARALFQFEDYDDVRGNLPRFVAAQIAGPSAVRLTWPQFAARWIDAADCVHTSYEALRATPVDAIAEVFDGLKMDVARARIEEVVASHDITKLKRGDKAGEEARTFVRRGKVGGFADYLDAPTIQLIEEACAPHMARLGYRPAAEMFAEADAGGA